MLFGLRQGGGAGLLLLLQSGHLSSYQTCFMGVLRSVAMLASALAQRLGWCGQAEGAGVGLTRLAVMSDIGRL